MLTRRVPKPGCSVIYIYEYTSIYIYIYIYVEIYICLHNIYLLNSPGLCPGRVRSSAFCVYCNICYVCKATFTFFRFCCNILCVCLATFAISAIVVVHCLDNCCLLFKKCAREGGCQGAPGHWNSLLFGMPFFEHFFWNAFFHTNVKFVTQIASKLDPKYCTFETIFRKKMKMKKCVWTAQACTDRI